MARRPGVPSRLRGPHPRGRDGRFLTHRAAQRQIRYHTKESPRAKALILAPWERPIRSRAELIAAIEAATTAGLSSKQIDTIRQDFKTPKRRRR